MYLFLGASWNIPATYTIGKVLDFSSVESTSTLYYKRSNTKLILNFYVWLRKCRTTQIGQLCSCPGFDMHLLLFKKVD